MDSISVGNDCLSLDSCGGDSDRGAIAGNHCRHHSRHQGCTMYIAVPAYFCVYIERRQLELKYCFFFITKEDGAILLGLKSLVFESYALLMDAQFIY